MKVRRFYLRRVLRHVARGAIWSATFAVAGCEWVLGIGDTKLERSHRGASDAGDGSAGTAHEGGGSSSQDTGGSSNQVNGGTSNREADSASGPVNGSGGASSGRAGSTSASSDAATQPQVLRPDIANRFFTGSPHLPTGQLLTACYQIESTGADADAQAARDAFAQHAWLVLQTNWLRYLPIEMLWGGKCPSAQPSFQITVSDTQPSDASAGGVTLNTASSDAEILHYLGKAFGFGTEYGFEKLPGPCVRCSVSAECTFGDSLVCLQNGYCGWPSDHESIMAAPGCGGIEPTRHLTPWDIASAQRIYGRKKKGAIVEARGMCLNVPDESTKDGQALNVHPCLGAPSDTWIANRDLAPNSATFLSVVLGAANRCLTAPAVDSGPTGPAVSATCNPADPRQDWPYEGTRLRAFGGLCVVPANVAKDAILVTTECSAIASNHELWNFVGGQFRVPGTNLCAEVSNTGAPGSQVALADCAAAPTSTQFFVGDPQLAGLAGHLFANSACLDLSRATPESGSSVVLSDACDDAHETQHFFVSGQLLAPQVARCLESPPFGATEDSPWVKTNRCTSALEQQWDVYW